MYEVIINNLLTKKDLDDLNHELGLLKSSDYEFGDDGFENVLNNNVRHLISRAIRQDLRDNDISVEQYVEGLQEKVRIYQIIELTLCFEPTRKTMGKIGEWVFSNVGEKVLVDYKFNPYLLGGAIIVSKGEYRNLSLNKMIDTFFENNRVEVDKVLSRSK